MTVVNFLTDQSEQAKCVRTYYDQAVRVLLADFPWPFATVQQKLNLVENFYSAERQFAYAYPVNCIKVRRLYSPFGYNRNDDVQSKQKYKIVQTPSPDNQGQMIKVILADCPNLWVEFTGNDTVVSDYSEVFVECLEYLLAWKMAPRLTGGDPYQLGEKAKNNFIQTRKTAETIDGNEEVPDDQRLGEFIDQRGGTIARLMADGWQAFPSGFSIENF
jgi:hypothetical protein